MVTQAVKAPLEGDGVIVIECMDRNGSLRFVELILRYKQDPGVDRSSQTSPDDISEINQPGEAYEEERGKAYEEPGNTYYEEDNPDLIPWIFDIGLPDVIVHPAHEPDRKQAYERPTGTHLTIEKPVREGPAKVRRGKQRQPEPVSTEEPASRAQRESSRKDGSADKASKKPAAATPQPETEPTQRPAGNRKPRNHIQGLQWITAIWAMGLTTAVVLVGVGMWLHTGGTLDLNPYLHSGITTGTALALGAVIVWAFKNVVDDKKKKDDDS
jgi:hypothetical protein